MVAETLAGHTEAVAARRVGLSAMSPLPGMDRGLLVAAALSRMRERRDSDRAPADARTSSEAVVSGGVERAPPSQVGAAASVTSGQGRGDSCHDGVAGRPRVHHLGRRELRAGVPISSRRLRGLGASPARGRPPSGSCARVRAPGDRGCGESSSRAAVRAAAAARDETARRRTRAPAAHPAGSDGCSSRSATGAGASCASGHAGRARRSRGGLRRWLTFGPWDAAEVRAERSRRIRRQRDGAEVRGAVGDEADSGRRRRARDRDILPRRSGAIELVIAPHGASDAAAARTAR
jgi:hypothetical protein